MDGRVFTLEDEIDVLHEDLGRARRRLDDLERAPFESRVADPGEHERSLVAARENVRELERELREALAAFGRTGRGVMADYDQKIAKKSRHWHRHGRRQPLFWIKNERKRVERTTWFESVQDLFSARGKRR